MNLNTLLEINILPFIVFITTLITTTLFFFFKNKSLEKNQRKNKELLNKYKPIISISEEIESLKLIKEKIINKSNLLDNEFKKKGVYFNELIEIEVVIKSKISEKEELEIKLNSSLKSLNELNSDFEKRDILHKSINDIEKSKEKKLNSLKKLKEKYKDKKIIYNSIIKEINIYKEDLEDLSYGLYKPHFDFNSPESYKNKIIEIRQNQKELIKAKKAAICNTKWNVNGNIKEGTKMTNRNTKLMLRAFNGECDSSVLKVRWNNVINLEKRISKSFEMVNRMGETNAIEIQDEYLLLKIDELRIAHEYKEKIHEEREERRKIQRDIKEETKVIKEIELARKEAEKEENKYVMLLEKAKLEVNKKHGAELKSFNNRILQLETQLSKVRELKERAISRAQITKSGHVYIISNIGAFGTGVYKIGMTRRLEPIERVYELSGASVPFKYDIHGMIYSENAPQLENQLHKLFSKSRVNRANNRKEFFKVTIDEIEKEVKKIDENIELIKTSEARQYRETLLMNNEDDKIDIDTILNKYPEEL
jgi:hypothetical protein